MEKARKQFLSLLRDSQQTPTFPEGMALPNVGVEMDGG